MIIIITLIGFINCLPTSLPHFDTINTEFILKSLRVLLVQQY